MVAVPAPLLFQYIARSTRIFIPRVVQVTIEAALPEGMRSPMLSVAREFAGARVVKFTL